MRGLSGNVSSISVKSGKNIFNSQSSKGQDIEFGELRARLKKLGKNFSEVVGYGYGRKSEPKKATVQDRVAGQKFWELLTNESDFYLRIARAIGIHSEGHGDTYRKAFEKKYNALVKEFVLNFVDEDGSIEWDKVVAFNSSVSKPEALNKL